ncbi:MAG: polysaccharide pyruvyl transferase family protein [Coriobacteriia bacterium]|nr:polysaccharide pyruvyl transferase family protein [Coriobacteriia bacterium]
MTTLFCIRPKGYNVGNDAIYAGMQHFLYEAFGEVVNLISIPATTRYDSVAYAGLTARSIHEINQYGHGVIVGGGNLYENGELDVNVEALGALQVPLMLFSLSRGRIYDRHGKLTDRTDVMPEGTVAALNRQASVSLARDNATGDYLRSIGFADTIVGGCPTCFLNRIEDRLPRLTGKDRADVLLSVRNPALMNVSLRRQSEVHDDVCRLIDFLRTRGHEDVRLLCHDHRDVAFAASFDAIDYVYTGDVYSYLAMLRACNLSVTYRLHAAIPCLSFGVPTIKISYDERALSLMDTIGFGEWNIDMVQTNDIVAAVADRYDRLGELAGIRAAAQPAWDRSYAVMSDGFRRFAAAVRDCAER